MKFDEILCNLKEYLNKKTKSYFTPFFRKVIMLLSSVFLNLIAINHLNAYLGSLKEYLI
jgi:hypothetical protein